MESCTLGVAAYCDFLLFLTFVMFSMLLLGIIGAMIYGIVYLVWDHLGKPTKNRKKK